MPINITCTICGKVVIKPPSEKNRKYCSAKCYGISQRKEPIKCSVPECDRTSITKGFCDKHYLAYRRKNNLCKKYRYYIAKVKKEITKINCNCCGIVFHPKLKTTKYCSKKCYAISKKSPFIVKKGYKKILVPVHHRADKKGYVFEHIIVAEQKLNRKLFPREVCHHIDKNKLNNNPNNIITFENNSDHIIFHNRLSK